MGIVKAIKRVIGRYRAWSDERFRRRVDRVCFQIDRKGYRYIEGVLIVRGLEIVHPALSRFPLEPDFCERYRGWDRYPGELILQNKHNKTVPDDNAGNRELKGGISIDASKSEFYFDVSMSTRNK